MIAIDNTLISENLLEKQFVCDLAACKGACCVEGDSGAPLSEEETQILEDIFDEVKPYMRPEGIKAVEEQGHWEMDSDGDYVTPLVEGKECAYVQFSENGTALCAIEHAHRDGKVNWKKPISCHLYPVRITKLKDYDALNYHKWHICSPACACGEKTQVPVYKFAKSALVRAYGEDWFEKLEAAAQLWKDRASNA
jgi:hypothetical protein